MKTLDEIAKEIEGSAAAVAFGFGGPPVDALLALVAHVGALGTHHKNLADVTQAWAERVHGHGERITALEDTWRATDRFIQDDHGRITALEAKVAALGNDIGLVREDMARRKDVEEIRLESDVERLSAENASLKELRKRNEGAADDSPRKAIPVELSEIPGMRWGRDLAAPASPVIPVDLGEIHAELNSLRAENGLLRATNERLLKEKHHLQNDINAARAEISRIESRHNEQLAEGRAVNTALTEERDRLRAEQATHPSPGPCCDVTSGMLDAARDKNSDTLGKIIEELESLPPDLVLPVGISRPHSYRGRYEQLGFEPAPNITAGECLKVATDCIGKTFTGYKGGEYTMDGYTSCWFSKWGSSGGVPLSAFLVRVLAALGRIPPPPGGAK